MRSGRPSLRPGLAGFRLTLAIGLAAGCVLALAAAACGDSGGSSGSGGSTGSTGSSGTCEPTLASIQSTIFVPTCAKSGCHNATDAVVGLDLTAADLEAKLVDQPASTCGRILVVPSNPAGSFLFEKISSATPQCGDRMPISETLDATQQACIEQWIAGLSPGCETCGGGACVDLTTDPTHCGDCATVCGTGASCVNGSCGCATGELCGTSCVDTQTDPNNCGMCGKPCNVAMKFCVQGSCSSTCNLTECGTSCVDTTSDPNNCGDCGVSCGTGTCQSSVCMCPGGGDTQTDPNNCGSCGHACSPGQACENGVCACGTASVSFSAAVQPIFTANCATMGCHTGVMPAEGLHLGAGKSYAKLVNVTATECTDGRKRVLPGSPDQSYLMDKLQGIDLCFGTKMPKTGSVSSTDLETIANWICEGAPNN
jgi:hypothetical protein